MTAYWLMKSEPNVFSFEDLLAEPNKTTCWEGVRNYQARNMMRDQMKRGDRVFFYHSNCDEPAIVGIAKIVKEGYPDHYAFEKGHRYFDPKSNKDNPRWYMVDIQAAKKMPRPITLAELKHIPELEGFTLTRKGNRLSVMPVEKEHWDLILKIK